MAQVPPSAIQHLVVPRTWELRTNHLSAYTTIHGTQTQLIKDIRLSHASEHRSKACTTVVVESYHSQQGGYVQDFVHQRTFEPLRRCDISAEKFLYIFLLLSPSGEDNIAPSERYTMTNRVRAIYPCLYSRLYELRGFLS